MKTIQCDLIVKDEVRLIVTIHLDICKCNPRKLVAWKIKFSEQSVSVGTLISGLSKYKVGQSKLQIEICDVKSKKFNNLNCLIDKCV